MNYYLISYLNLDREFGMWIGSNISPLSNSAALEQAIKEHGQPIIPLYFMELPKELYEKYLTFCK